MKIINCLIVATALLNASIPVTADPLKDLLDEVQSGNLEKSQTALDLEKQFTRSSDKAALVKELNSQRVALENESESLEDAFNKNEEDLEKLRNLRQKEQGDLANFIGLVEQAAAESTANFDTSIISAQYPERSDDMAAIAKKIAQTNDLVTLGEIESVWQQMLGEMVEQGRVVTFSADVATTSGARESTSVTRVGTFNLVANGKFLDYEAGAIAELSRQPAARFLSQAQAIQAASGGSVDFAVDPTRGALLGAAVESPSLMERVNQGGLVGYIILGVGALAVVLAIFKIVMLTLTGAAVNKQAQSPTSPTNNNPLGRVLSVLSDSNNHDNTDALEMKLSEAIMAETPKLNSGLMFLKIVSVVAPLAGLLGTVLGMIQTFQAITLFGAGDPKLMAGGISQALVTTVCGLVVAIPVVLLHTAAASRAKRIEEVLEEQATGMVARQLES